jgi:FkbM family methyltransferase
LTSGDVVLDIGGHVGGFARHAEALGVARVISVEPDSDNFGLLRKNTIGFGKITRINRAVVSSKVTSWKVTLYRNTHKSRGLHTLLPMRGRKPVIVRAIQFLKLLRKYRPDKVKCDCEGGEYDLLFNTILPKFVKRLAIEIHFQPKAVVGPLAVKLHKRILSQGFVAVREPRFGLYHRKGVGIVPVGRHTLAVYKRKIYE